MTSIKIFIIGLVFIIFSSNCFAEPTKLQKEMMNETASMMDIFILRHNLYYSSLDNSIEIDEYTIYPVKIKDLGSLQIAPTVTLELDWVAGSFYINSFEMMSPEPNKLNFTFSNAKNLCLSMLESISYNELYSFFALHKGYTVKTYNSEKENNFDGLTDGLGLAATLILREYTHLDGKRTSQTYFVECKTLAIDINLENVTFSFKGEWK
jgi:hypothetical protein